MHWSGSVASLVNGTGPASRLPLPQVCFARHVQSVKAVFRLILGIVLPLLSDNITEAGQHIYDIY